MCHIVTKTRNANLVHATDSLRDPSCQTKGNDPVYLYAKACAHKHTHTLHVHRTDTVNRKRLNPLSIIAPFKCTSQQ